MAVDTQENPLPDQFSLVRVLGRGGFATVYLAEWRTRAADTPDRVAVKVAHAHADPRLAREAQAMRRVGPPWVPAVFAEGQTATGAPYLVMEFVDADSLADRMRAGRVEPTLAMRMVRAVALALARVHERGVVHRDVTPDNVLLRPIADSAASDTGLQAVLIDLGLSHWRGLSRSCAREAALEMPFRTRADEVTGTPPYMAPEQWTSNDAGSAADIYALGAIAFRLLTGRLPFEGSPADIRRGHVTGRCPPPSRSTPAAAPWDAIVLQCLDKQPEQRFSSALALADSIARALAAPVSAKRARPSDPHAGTPPSPASVGDAHIALLALTTEAPPPTLSAALERRDAVLAHTHGTRYVIAFPWATSPTAGVRDAVDATRALSRRLDARGALVVHLAPLRVRKRKRGVRVRGDALKRVQMWDAPPAGIEDEHGAATPQTWLTEPAAHALHPHTVKQVTPGWYRIAVEPPASVLPAIDARTVALRGRQAMLDDALATVHRCIDESIPLLAVFKGGVGHGKTRVLNELSARLQRREGVRIERFTARSSRDAPPDHLLVALFRRMLELDGDVTMTAIDDALHARGVRVHDAGRYALGQLLGALSRTRPQVAAIASAPGALRRALSRALATVLAHAAARAPLVVVIDDAHRADLATLDALELATVKHAAIDITGTVAPVPLSVVVAAAPPLWDRRPRFGDRAGLGRRHTLDGLPQSAANRLLGDLLRPAEFVPQGVLDKLYRLSNGVPLYLVELAHAVRASPAMRRRTGTAAERPGYYIATDELDRIVETRVDRQLARTRLDALPAPIVPLAYLCAVLGAGFTSADIRGVQTALERDPPEDGALDAQLVRPLLAIDASVGLAQLCRHGVTTADDAGAGYALRHPILSRAIENAMPGPHRRRLHSVVEAYLRERGEVNDYRLAHHAAHGEHPTRAARLFLALAERAGDSHRYMDAEAHYTQALVYDVRERRRALAGRGRMRYRLQRHADALDDLQKARELAVADGDSLDVIRLLLQEATVLDWCYRWKESAERVADAIAASERYSLPDELAARLSLARGLVLDRQDQHASAIDWLRQAAERGDAETRTIAHLLLGVMLCYCDQLDEAALVFSAVIDVCRRSGDEFHLAVATINRHLLWTKRGRIDRLEADMRDAAQMAHLLGNAEFERAAVVNLAEALYWQGAWEQALSYGHRAVDLQRRFVSDASAHEGHLLLARVLVAQADARARTYLDWLRAHCDLDSAPPSTRHAIALVELALEVIESAHESDSDWIYQWDHTWRAAWSELVQNARAHPQNETHIEIMVTAVALLRRRGHMERARTWLARALGAEPVIWRARLQTLAAELGVACASN